MACTVDVEVRIRRSWLLMWAFYLTGFIRSVYPIGDGLIDLAGRFTTIEQRIDGGSWVKAGHVYVLPNSDECEFNCPGGAACECQVIGVRR